MREGRREGGRERRRGSEADSGRRERDGGSIVFTYLKSVLKITAPEVCL